MLLNKINTLFNVHLSSFLTKFKCKLLYGKRICLAKNVTFGKSTDVFLGKNGKVEILQNFTSRKNLTIRLSDEADVKVPQLKIGSDCFFNNYCSINVLNKVAIGRGCIFGENVKIYDHNHKYNGSLPIRELGFSSAPVSIGNNVWVGANAVILMGVEIGDNSIIGAGCIVYKNVPPNTILLSNGEIRKK